MLEKILTKMAKVVCPERDISVEKLRDRFFLHPRDTTGCNTYLLEGTYSYDEVVKLNALTTYSAGFGFCSELGPIAFIGIPKYNNKQTREDRKIEDYFKKVCDSQNDIACEIIIELGDMDFWNDKDQEYRLKMIDVYNEQIKDLTKIVPTFKIANATIHFDETSPHLHIVGVPIIENCKRGMKKQVGKSQVFTKTSLTEIQDKMRNACIKSYNKFYEVDTKLKE